MWNQMFGLRWTAGPKNPGPGQLQNLGPAVHPISAARSSTLCPLALLYAASPNDSRLRPASPTDSCLRPASPNAQKYWNAIYTCHVRLLT